MSNAKAKHIVDLMADIDQAVADGATAEDIAEQFGIDSETVKLVMQSRSLFNRINGLVSF